MSKILIINGPNINLLGEREQSQYGSTTFDDLKKMCIKKSQDIGVELDFKQSNIEGEIVNFIQDAKKNSHGIIINAGGYTHTSVAIYDALLSLNIPIIEVHISNIYKREKFRHSSYVSMAANSVISGFGIDGYIFALESMLKSIKN